MNGHARGCDCDACLLDLELKASWYGWRVGGVRPYKGWRPWLPTVPANDWRLWFHQTADRREMVRAKVEVLLQAQDLIKRT